MDTTLLTVIGGASAVVAVFAVAAMVYMTSRRDRMLANLADRFAEDRERQVRRRERHAATVVNSMTDGIVTTDGEGIIVDINPAAERIFHVRSTESCGKPVATILPDPLGHHKTGGLVAVLSQNDASLPATTARRRSEPVHHGQRGDGREVPISITVTRVEVEDGSLFVAVVRDITERVVADETESLIRAIDNHLLLGSSTEEICKEVCLRVGRLFSLSAIWVGLKEEGGRIQVVARSGGDVDRMGPMDEQWREEDDGSLGPAGKALVRGRVIDLAVGHGGAATDGLGSQAISGFDMAPTPGWAQPLGPGRLVVFPLWTNNAVAGCMALHLPDVHNSAEVLEDEPSHEQRLSEAILRRLDTIAARLGAAFQTIQDQSRLRLHSTAMAAAANAIFITDTDGQIQWVNAAFCRLSGYGETEVIGKKPNLLKSGLQSDDVYRELWDALLGGRPWRGEMIERRKDGRTYVVEETITPIANEDGAITHFVAVQEDVTARKKAEERIRYLSNYDTLTRLPNRVLFRDRLYQAVIQSRKMSQGLAVLFIDLDQFSRVNDTLGHAAGDQMLMIIASRILAVAEEADTVARLGGDEFALIQPNAPNAEAAAVLASRVVEAIHTPVDLGGQIVRVRANVGITLYPQDATDPDSLIQNADMAMYRAVRTEGEVYSFFSAEMNAEAAKRLGLEEKLRHALENQGLTLNFQPQFDFRSKRPTGVEALCRWVHPEMGNIPPSTFIPVAEESGLILQLGDWVMEESFRTLARWRSQGLTNISMAVNLSAVQFRKAGLLDRVRELLSQYDLPASKIELELTESMLLQDGKGSIKLLEELSELGVRLSIDDFGTGYSSLAYLKQFSVDCLKVDQSFVRHLVHGSSDAVIARAIIGLGHSLGLAVVAEGVETEEQYNYLRDEGCDIAQGYLLAKPLPEAEAMAVLEASREPQDVTDESVIVSI